MEQPLTHYTKRLLTRIRSCPGAEHTHSVTCRHNAALHHCTLCWIALRWPKALGPSAPRLLVHPCASPKSSQQSVLFLKPTYGGTEGMPWEIYLSIIQLYHNRLLLKRYKSIIELYHNRLLLKRCKSIIEKHICQCVPLVPPHQREVTLDIKYNHDEPLLGMTSKVRGNLLSVVRLR